MPKVIDENKIFEATIEMFVTRGYERTTTNEIAGIAGVNETTLFRKYHSKAELFEKAIYQKFSNTPLSKLLYTGELEADLRSIVVAYIETNRLFGEIIPTLMTEIPRHPKLKGAFAVLQDNIQSIAGIIQEYQMKGLLKEEPPFASLNALIGPLMTHQMFRRVDLEFSLPDINIGDYVSSFLNGRSPSFG